MIKCDIFSWALGFALLLCVTEANQLSAQGCPDLRGTWKVTESATLTIRVNGESETITEGDTGTIQINQDGCTVSYVKSLGGFEAERLGTIEGNTVTLTGIAAVPVQGVTCSKNTLILVGTIDGNRIDATSTVDIECTDGIVVQTVTGGGPVIFTGPPRGSITVTSPNGGEIWRLGTTETVTWQSEGLDGSNVRLDLYQSGNFLSAIESSSQDGGNFHWDIPNDLRTGDDYSIRIAATSDDTINDFTDAVFEIRHDVIVESLGGSTQLGSGANLGDQWWWSEWVVFLTGPSPRGSFTPSMGGNMSSLRVLGRHTSTIWNAETFGGRLPALVRLPSTPSLEGPSISISPGLPVPANSSIWRPRNSGRSREVYAKSATGIFWSGYTDCCAVAEDSRGPSFLPITSISLS